MNINDVLKYATEAHRGQTRKTGQPYIVHPIAVSKIVEFFGGDEESICAALLHDVVEDTPISLEEIERRFGKNIAFLVDGVTKLEDKEETLKKIERYAEKDKRVILIKLADRLHNVETAPGREYFRDFNKIYHEYLESTKFYVKIGREAGYDKLSDRVEKAIENWRTQK